MPKNPPATFYLLQFPEKSRIPVQFGAQQPEQPCCIVSCRRHRLGLILRSSHPFVTTKTDPVRSRVSSFREAWSCGRMHGHRGVRSWGWGSRPATSWPASRPGGRTAGPGTTCPSSPTSRSTSPRCPAACRSPSTTLDTPAKKVQKIRSAHAVVACS